MIKLRDFITLIFVIGIVCFYHTVVYNEECATLEPVLPEPCTVIQDEKLEDNTVNVPDTTVSKDEPDKLIEELRFIDFTVPKEPCDASDCRFNTAWDPDIVGLSYIEVSNENLFPGKILEIGETVDIVLYRFSIIPKTKDIRNLLMRTFMHESKMASIPMSSVGGQGIGQVTISSARHFIERLKSHEPSDYNELQNLTYLKLDNPSTEDLKKELNENLQFAIAMSMLTYYFHDPVFYSKIGTIEKDAVMWKKNYNTLSGAGTVEGFIKSAHSLDPYL